VITASALVLTPVRLAAQNQDQPLSDLLPGLYTDVSLREFRTFASAFSFLDFDSLIDDVVTALQQRLELSRNIISLAGNQLSSFPLGSASGGFTWALDTSSGVFTRASTSFGPIFAERPLTIGHGRLNVGMNFQHVGFDHLEGRSLRGGEIVGYLGVKPFEDDFGVFFADTLDLTVTTDTLNAFATYGLTDRLDIGVAVPINRVSMNASLTSRVGNTVSGISTTTTPVVTSDSGTASGIGDVVIRAKYNMLNRKTFAIAESADVRLPTGDELNLLGIAGSQVKLGFIASAVAGKVSPHLNLGYTISGSSSAADDPDTFVFPPSEEFNYAGGADYALSLRTTIAFDAVGRILRKAGTVTMEPSTFGPQFPQFRYNSGEDLHLLLGSVGVKVNPFANMLVTASVLFPMTNSGLTDSLTCMAGGDYSF